MSRDWQSYLADVRTASEKVLLFTAGMDRDSFFADDKTYHAVIHCLLIIGEAVKHVPEPVRQEMPEVEWRRVAGMRTGWHTFISLSTATSFGTWSRRRSLNC